MINTILLTINEVKHITSISTATIYRLMAEDKFPKSVNVFGRRVAWIASEVDAWVASSIAKSRPEALLIPPAEAIEQQDTSHLHQQPTIDTKD